MRILLIHPPLIKSESKALLQAQDDNDNSRVSIGVYSLAALMHEQGHEVKLYNHSTFPWKDSLDAAVAFAPDLVGIACLTSQRMVVGAWAESIKKRLKGCKVVLGGPHASCLYEEILKHWPAVDFVAVGEAEESLGELVRRLESDDALQDIPGMAVRNEDGSIHWPGPARPIADLAALPIPARYYHYDIITTSRGCPYRCSFCCSPILWGSRVRERPVAHIIEELEHLKRKQQSLVAFFKDETFTLRTARVKEVCQAILDAGLDLEWFCDTRVDRVDEERIYWIRKAGCTQVSFGIESGSPRILQKIEKKTTPDQIRKATRLARDFGLHVRYYLMAGFPDERPEDLKATVSLVNECKPTYIVLTPLILNPGTQVFQQYCDRYGADNNLWFEPGPRNLLYDRDKKWLVSPAGKRLRKLSYLEKDEDEQKFKPPTEEELRTSLKYPGLARNFNTTYALAQFLRDKKRFAEALVYYQRALEIRPGHGRALVYTGVCLEKLGHLQEAMRFWEKVEALDHVVNIVLHQARIHRGLGSITQGDTETALSLWRSAHLLLPDSEEPLRLIAEYAAESNRWQQAEWAARRWAEQSPQTAQPHYIAALSCFNQGELKEAETFFAAAHRLEPNNMTILSNYARFLASTGRKEEAEELVNQTNGALIH